MKTSKTKEIIGIVLMIFGILIMLISYILYKSPGLLGILFTLGLFVLLIGGSLVKEK